MTDKVIFVTQSLQDVRITDVEGVGALRWEGDNLYRWVKYEGSTVLSGGNLVAHQLSEGGDLLDEVGVVATADLSFLAGVVMPDEVPDSSSTARYFWVQVLGVHAGVSILPHTQTTGNWALGQYVIGVNGQAYGTQGQLTAPAYSRNLQLLALPTTHTTPTANVRSVACFVRCL